MLKSVLVADQIHRAVKLRLSLVNPPEHDIVLFFIILPVLAETKRVQGEEQNNDHKFSWFGYDLYILF